MVNFKKLADRAKDVVEARGGPEGLKNDANSLRDIAKSKGTLKDKAMAAKDALKETGGSEPHSTREGGASHSKPTASTSHEPSPEAKERHAGGTSGNQG